MAVQKDNYQLLIEKLDQFIRKFYVNQLIRGTLYSVGLVLLLFLAITILEHFFFFSTGVRKLMFFSFLGISGLALTGWVALPLMHYFRLGKVISHEYAADIIGNHFTEVKDKLLNILQLKHQSYDVVSADLVRASINQKIGELEPVPFKAAINLNQNRQHLKYAVPPLLLLMILLFAAPNLIPSSTARLINNNRNFERPAPFSFTVENNDLTVVQYDDYNLDVKVNANEVGGGLPNEVFIIVDNYQYKLVKNSPSSFTYKFSKVAKETRFNLTASGFDSKDYDLSVLKKPNIVGFDIRIDYPGYTGRKDETISNIGDIVVPIGTNLSWAFSSENTDNIDVLFTGSNDLKASERAGSELFTVKRRALKNENYTVFVSNEFLPNADSVAYAISVIPDLYPTISLEQFVDSTDEKLIFFVGDASDDYGLKSLSFNYRIEGEDRDREKLESTPVAFANGKQSQYDYTWDIREMQLNPGDKITYYFEVFDNDAVNGSKSSRTNIMSYAMPTVEEFEQMEEENNEEIKDELEKSIEEARELRKDLRDLKDKLIQKKDLDWQDRKEIEKMLERQKELQENLENAKDNFNENQKNQQEFEETKESILEKQEKIESLFEELMSDEMKELMQKIEELLDEMSRDDALMELEDMEMSDEELEKELDRLLELFKELELEHQLEQTVEKLEELAKEQEELSEETKEAGEQADEEKQEELEKKQEELNEEFDKLQEEMEKLDEMNKELESPKDLGDQQEQSEEIEQDMENSSQELQQQQNNKASESQKKAAQKMQDMAQQMRSQMASAQMEQMQEDIESLRQLLENLVDLSFDQEEIMKNIQQSNINTPNYVKLVQEQYKLKDDFKLVEDSLQALSKRVFQIEAFVTEKVTDVKKNFKQGLKDLEERKKGAANVQQQYAMTGVNDLALMLSEVMEQMQQQMANSMPGSQMCQKPGQGQSGKGKGKGKMKLGDMQQQLNDQLSKMQEMMKQGKMPGGKKGKNGMSKQFAEMAAKQAAIRKALQEKAKEAQEQGQGDKDLQKLIEEMDKTETDLVNKRLSNEMMKRQQEIMTRLLESEQAQREREYDEKRKSEIGKAKDRKMPPSLEEYIKKREAEIEMYKAVSPALKPYYKSLVEDYFQSLRRDSE